MPVDDCKFSCYIKDYDLFKQANHKRIKRPYWKVFEDDGDVKTEEDDGSYESVNDENLKWRIDKTGAYRYTTIIHYSGFQTYDLQIKETTKEFIRTGERTKTFFLTLTGSIKANCFGGINAGKFSFHDLQREIKLIEQLGLNSEEIKIDNLAPSICLELPFPVLEFLSDSLISYRGHRFKQYDPDKSGKVIGCYCPLGQLHIKIYDKSLQLNVPGFYMQFEDSFTRMRRIKNDHDISCLADLKSRNKVVGLVQLLLKTWDDILLYDSSLQFTGSSLNDRQLEMIKWGDNPKYWEKLKGSTIRSTYNNRIKEYRGLSQLYGSNSHNKIREMIIDEWESLFKCWTKSPGVEHTNLDKITGSVGGDYIQLKLLREKNKKMVDRLKAA